MNTAAIFWCSQSEVDGTYIGHHHRPLWFDKKKCFKSFHDAATKAGLDIYVIYDGLPNGYSEYIQSKPIKEFIYLNNRNASKSLQDVYNRIYAMIDVYDYFYISEDDYLYKTDAFIVLEEGVKKIGQDGVYSLYEHPDRYTRTDDMTYGKEFINITKSCYWRTVESTCYTFCLTKKVLLKYRNELTKPLLDRDLFRFLLSENIRLWCPMPSQASHMNENLFASFVNWEELNKNTTL
jgi:hypothetical protein